jgi:hypothetical protein
MATLVHVRRYPHGNWMWVNLDYVAVMERLPVADAPLLDEDAPPQPGDTVQRVTSIRLHDGTRFAVIDLPREILTTVGRELRDER